MELRPGFKKTEIGVIPEDWDTLPFHCVFRKIPAKNFQIQTTEYQSSGSFPVVDQGQEQVVGYSDRADRVCRVPEGGVVIFGDHTCIVKHVKHDFVVGAEGTQILASKDGQDATFHALALSMRPVEATGYNRHFKFLKERRFQAPPDPEQKAIAEALSDVDALIAALSRLIDKKRDLRQGAMQRLLTGQTRLPGFTAPWQEKRLGELAVVRSQKVTGAALPIGTPCIELDQIASGSGRLIATGTASMTSVKNSFEPGDVLFGRLRAYLRKFWLADRKGVCSTEIWPLVPVEGLATSGFVFYTIQRSDFIDAAAQSYGTHMPRSDWGVVKNFEVLTPKPDEQTAIAQALSDMDGEIAALDARLEKTRALKQAMMQALLTGRVRLPVRREAAVQTKEVAHA